MCFSCYIIFRGKHIIVGIVFYKYNFQFFLSIIFAPFQRDVIPDRLFDLSESLVILPFNYFWPLPKGVMTLYRS